MIFIVAGSKVEYAGYIANKGIRPENARYIAKDSTFKGNRINSRDEVRFIGTWFNKKGTSALMATILVSTVGED